MQATRVKERITFEEAKERILSKFIRPGVSFATILAKYKKDAIYFKNQPKKTPAEPSTKKKRRLSDDKQVVESPAKLPAAADASKSCLASGYRWRLASGCRRGYTSSGYRWRLTSGSCWSHASGCRCRRRHTSGC